MLDINSKLNKVFNEEPEIDIITKWRLYKGLDHAYDNEDSMVNLGEVAEFIKHVCCD